MSFYDYKDGRVYPATQGSFCVPDETRRGQLLRADNGQIALSKSPSYYLLCANMETCWPDHHPWNHSMRLCTNERWEYLRDVPGQLQQRMYFNFGGYNAPFVCDDDIYALLVIHEDEDPPSQYRSVIGKYDASDNSFDIRYTIGLVDDDNAPYQITRVYVYGGKAYMGFIDYSGFAPHGFFVYDPVANTFGNVAGSWNGQPYAFIEHGGELWVGGYLDDGTTPKGNVYSFNGSTWTKRGTLDYYVFSFGHLGGSLYAGGSFQQINQSGAPTPCFHFAQWGGSNWIPTSVSGSGSHLDDNVDCMVEIGSYLYLGGKFKKYPHGAGGDTGYAMLCRWDGSNLSPVPTNVFSGQSGILDYMDYNEDAETLFCLGHFDPVISDMSLMDMGEVLGVDEDPTVRLWNGAIYDVARDRWTIPHAITSSWLIDSAHHNSGFPRAENEAFAQAVRVTPDMVNKRARGHDGRAGRYFNPDSDITLQVNWSGVKPSGDCLKVFGLSQAQFDRYLASGSVTLTPRAYRQGFHYKGTGYDRRSIYVQFGADTLYPRITFWWGRYQEFDEALLTKGGTYSYSDTRCRVIYNQYIQCHDTRYPYDCWFFKDVALGHPMYYFIPSNEWHKGFPCSPSTYSRWTLRHSYCEFEQPDYWFHGGKLEVGITGSGAPWALT